MQKVWKRTKPQVKAWALLMDKTIREVLFGGGAGGAKTYLGCMWLIIMCQKYPGTRWLMGRTVLKRLKETTLRTFFDITTDLQISHLYKYKQMDGIIQWKNGSEIILKDLSHKPSDPNYDALGSLEITGGFIDEANQVTNKCKGIVLSRMRYRLDEYGLMPKLLMSCNPAKNWVYSVFYKPWKEGNEDKGRRYVQALAKDNPFLPSSYIDTLKSLDRAARERLLYGNWEYDDDPMLIFDFEGVHDMHTNAHDEREDWYMTCDIARYGKDKTVVMLWKGLQLVGVYSWGKASTTESAETIITIAESNRVGRSHVLIDEDGVGGGVLDQVPGAKGFMGASAIIMPREAKRLAKMKKESELGIGFGNLRAQCVFGMAHRIDAREVSISDGVDVEDRERLYEELSYFRKSDKEGRAYVEKKSLMIERLGRSPDYADAFWMREYFELRKVMQFRTFSV